MADLADVESALVSIIAAATYPNGTAQPSAILSGGVPVDVKVGRAWPTKESLAMDLAASVANVSVYSQPGAERNTTRFKRDWAMLTPAVPTITVSVTDTTITLGGTVSAPQNMAVVTNGQAYTYAVQASDTLSTVAAALATLVNAGTPASSSGPAITIPGAVEMAARSGGFGTMIRELKRQERLFQISVWTVDPIQRDAVAAFVDAALAGMGQADEMEFIALADGSYGRLLYVRSAEIERDATVQAYRRDLIYSVEYATTETQAIAQIVTITETVAPSDGNAADTAPLLTLNL